QGHQSTIWSYLAASNTPRHGCWPRRRPGLRLWEVRLLVRAPGNSPCPQTDGLFLHSGVHIQEVRVAHRSRQRRPGDCDAVTEHDDGRLPAQGLRESFAAGLRMSISSAVPPNFRTSKTGTPSLINDPVWIMFRSGTELAPKAIISGEWAWITAMTSGLAL